MSHHLYNTEGFVLASKNVKEANKLFFILTPDLGLIAVVAQGIRKSSSKLRYQLKDLSYIGLSTVRGREFWRLTGAEEKTDLKNIFKDKTKLKFVARVFSLLQRYIYDEQKRGAEDLFIDLKKALVYLEELPAENLADQVEDLEFVLMLRIMNRLGYLKSEEPLRPFTEFANWSGEVVQDIRLHKTLAAKTINLSFQHSHI